MGGILSPRDQLMVETGSSGRAGDDSYCEQWYKVLRGEVNRQYLGRGKNFPKRYLLTPKTPKAIIRVITSYAGINKAETVTYALRKAPKRYLQKNN